MFVADRLGFIETEILVHIETNPSCEGPEGTDALILHWQAWDTRILPLKVDS